MTSPFAVDASHRHEYTERKRGDRKNMWAEKKKQEKSKKEAEEFDANFVADSVIHFAGAVEGTKREDLKDVFGKVGEVAWVDYSQNDKEGHVRMNGGAAEVCWEVGVFCEGCWW